MRGVVAASAFVPIRAVGGLFAVVLLVNAIRRHLRRDSSRLNLLITGAVAVAILLLAVVPALFRPLFDAFNFQKGNQRQLIAALVFAVFILFWLQLRTSATADANAATMRLLIEALTIQATA
jgi:hypothetical protein